MKLFNWLKSNKSETQNSKNNGDKNRRNDSTENTSACKNCSNAGNETKIYGCFGVKKEELAPGILKDLKDTE